MRSACRAAVGGRPPAVRRAGLLAHLPPRRRRSLLPRSLGPRRRSLATLGQTVRRARDDPGRQGDRGGDPRRAHRAGGRAGRRRSPAGARHAAGRRRPGQPLVRQRQAQGLRRRSASAASSASCRRRRRRPTCSRSSRSSTPTRPAPATSSSCRCRGQVDEYAVLEAMDPAKDADGLHPANLGRLVLNVPGPLPCTPVGIVELLRRYDVPIAGAEVVVDRPRDHRRPPARAAAHPPLGERDRDAVPHRHPRPRRARAHRRHRRRRGRRARG